VNAIDIQMFIDEQMRIVLHVINVNIQLLLFERGFSTKKLPPFVFEKEEIYGIPLEEAARRAVQGWPERRVAEIDYDYNEAKVRMGVEDPIERMAEFILRYWHSRTFLPPTKESVYAALHLHLRTVKTRFPFVSMFVRWTYLIYFYLKEWDVQSLREAKQKAEEQLKLEQQYIREGWYGESEAMNVAKLTMFLDDPSFWEKEEESEDSGRFDPRARLEEEGGRGEEEKEEIFVF
jgi:hypothetical protein